MRQVVYADLTGIDLRNRVEVDCFMDPIQPFYDCQSEELSHTAEIGLRLRAGCPEHLYACAGCALSALVRSPGDASNLPSFVC